MRNLPITLLASTLLSACGPTYSDTLDSKLAGKSPNEQRTILAQECQQEIQTGLKPHNEANVQHVERMREICEEMTGKKLAASAPPK
jgi:hypothetical protein